MFVVSMKTTRPRIAAYGIALGLLAVVTFGLAGRQNTLPTATAPTSAEDAGRVAYLQGLGYEVEPQWTDVREITIPAELDDALTAYNELQKEVGHDLIDYRGQRVKCYTYRVLNYPGADRVTATLYVYRDRVIAGDISSAEQDGFSHGLKPLIAEQGEENGTTG